MTDDFVIRWDVESPPDENKFNIETPEYHNDVISWDVSKKPDPKELEEETKKLEERAKHKVAKTLGDYISDHFSLDEDEEDEWDERERRRREETDEFFERLMADERLDDNYRERVHEYADECGWNHYPGAWRRLLDSYR
jgi:hypothetical protein